MRETYLSEWLLARFVGDKRAAAILGDLLEISADRGRLWFWAAYLRTLLSVGWRGPVAIVFAYCISNWMAVAGFRIIFSFLRHSYRVPYYRTAYIWHISPAVGDSLIALWFILPFILVRFGLRDRVTQLASAFFLLTIPFFTLSPAGVNSAELAMIGTIMTALCLPRWRRPMLVLAATVAPVAVGIILSPKVWYVFLSRGYGFSTPQLQRFMALYRAVELCVAAVVCSKLYRIPLERKRPERRTIA